MLFEVSNHLWLYSFPDPISERVPTVPPSWYFVIPFQPVEETISIYNFEYVKYYNGNMEQNLKRQHRITNKSFVI